MLEKAWLSPKHRLTPIEGHKQAAPLTRRLGVPRIVH